MGDKWFQVYETPANKINRKAIYPWTILTVSSVPELTYSIDTKDIQFSISNQQHRDIAVQRGVPDLASAVTLLVAPGAYLDELSLSFQ